MFGNKNSAIPYVRIGGVDRQSILTSNANGNTPVKEIGVDANGNLLYSTDYANYTKVKSIDLKYSTFVPDDDSKSDYWQVANGGKGLGIMAHNDDLENPEECGVQIGAGAVTVVGYKNGNASTGQFSFSNTTLYHSTENGGQAQFLLDGASGVSIDYANGDNKSSSIKIENNIVTLKASETASNETTQSSSVSVAKDGVTIAGKLTLPNSVIQEDGSSEVEEWTNATGVQLHTKSATTENKILAGASGIGLVSGDLSGTSTAPIVTTIGIVGQTTTLQSRNGNTIRNVKFTPTSTTINDKEIAIKDDIPSVEQSTGTSTTATMSQDAVTTALKGKLSTSGGTLTGDLKLTIGKNIADSNNKVLIKTNANGVIFGDPTSLTSIKGSQVRPFYTSGSDNTTKSLALYADIPDYFTTAGTTGGNISGSLTLTAGHLYRIWANMGDAQLSCMVKMPNPMVEQYWFMGINLYGHYCRLHISSAGVVTYQYANIGQNNWTDNASAYINYEDLTSKG